jgi:hypothetical protein
MMTYILVQPVQVVKGVFFLHFFASCFFFWGGGYHDRGSRVFLLLVTCERMKN